MRQRLASLSVEVGLRAAAAVAVPLLVLLLVGRLDLAAYATFGAFTALYGRNEPYRLRLRSVSVAAVALLVSIALGVAVAVAGEPLWLVTVLLVVVVVVVRVLVLVRLVLLRVRVGGHDRMAMRRPIRMGVPSRVRRAVRVAVRRAVGVGVAVLGALDMGFVVAATAGHAHGLSPVPVAFIRSRSPAPASDRRP